MLHNPIPQHNSESKLFSIPSLTLHQTTIRNVQHQISSHAACIGCFLKRSSTLANSSCFISPASFLSPPKFDSIMARNSSRSSTVSVGFAIQAVVPTTRALKSLLPALRNYKSRQYVTSKRTFYIPDRQHAKSCHLLYFHLPARHQNSSDTQAHPSSYLRYRQRHHCHR